VSLERALVLRFLAARLRAGYTMRAALTAGDAPGELIDASRRIRLGVPSADALRDVSSAFGGDADSIRLVAGLHARTGGDAASMLDAIADAMEERAEAIGRARAGAAGARLSARVIACLPLAALLLLPGSKAPLLDPMGMCFLLVGLGLCFAGMRWIDRLLPIPEDRVDPAALLAVVAGAALRSGCNLGQVMEAAAARDPTLLGRAGRLRRLGFSWPEALARSDDPALGSLGAALLATHRTGVPVIPALDAFARRRAAESASEFERAIRRAPVKMVVPLTLCVLPAFGFIALTPFLRSLAPA
jgi:tight adherence protein B